MKITGTKKLLIIFFALMCALTACLGVVISRAFTDTAYAETGVPAPDAASAAEDLSVEDEDMQEEFVEEEYDERFDEHTIRQVADLLDTYPEVVTFYCRVNNVDARELLASLREDEQKELEARAAEEAQWGVEYFGHSETEEDLVAPDETADYASKEEEFPEEELSYNEQLTDTLREFRVAYERGEITAPEGIEDEDWYIAPDDMGTYATTWYFTGYNNSSFTSQFGWSFSSTQLKQSRTIHHPNTFTTSTTDGRVLYWEYYVELAPGESYKITRARLTSTTDYNTTGGYDQNSHWAYTLFYGWRTDGGSTLIIDGDAPSGTVFWFRSSIDTNPTIADSGSYVGRAGRGRASWNGASGNTHATYGRTAVADNSGSFYNYYHRCSNSVAFKLIVKRTSPVAPTLVDDTATNGGSVDLTKNKKTAYFEGNPVLITISKDFGAGIIGYSIDDTVTLKSRSTHGVTNFGTASAASQTGGANIVFQCSTYGTHTIKIKILQPAVTAVPWPGVNNADGNAGATMVSTKMSWKDASGNQLTATEISFTLEIKLQDTDKPTMVRDSDGVVNGYGDFKTVNYDGNPHTVTFEHCDPAFVGWSSNGLTQATGTTWDSNNKKLVLQQTERGTYTINLYLKNPAGVTWRDGSTDSLQFTFKIDNQLLERPKQVGTNSYTKTVSYNGGDWQTLTVSPAIEDQLILVTTGLKYDLVDLDGDLKNDAIAFKMQDSGEGKIMIMPAEGFVWKDGKSETITFTLTIEAIEVPVPKLLGLAGTTKTVTFDPADGWAAELVITNIPKDAIDVVTALQYDEFDDWVPKDVYDGKVDPADIPSMGYTDFDYDVLTLRASNANTYPVTFSLTSPNYRWAVGTTVPTYYLTINRYVLQHPKISDYEYKNNKDKIDGATKTVYYNTDPDSGNYTDSADKYYKLFVGGFTRSSGLIAADQISIRYSLDGLRESWPDQNADGSNPDPELTLWGTTTGGAAGPAGNYIIYITPTSNYIWDTGNDDMYTYKFVITPIFRDQLRMYTQQGTGNSWVVDGGDRTSTADYDGTPKYFRIGTPDNPTQYFYDSQATYALVNQAYEPISAFGMFNNAIDNKYDKDEYGNTPTVLMCSAVEAGTYIIRLRLRNTNYAWRDGSGADIYYTFTIKARSIKDPEILGSECAGGSENSLKVYDTYIHCGYNGAACQLVISLPKAKNSLGESIIKIYTNPSGMDVDPENGKDALQQISWGEASDSDDGITRLVLEATIVGDHRVLLMIEDPNFKWETDCEYYAFELRIDYAEVDDVMFNYGLPENLTKLGGNGERYEETYNSEDSHYITITRSTDEFAKTPFKTQFLVEVSYKEPSYEMKSETYTSDSLILEFKDANIYYISVYLTTNYRWRSNHRSDTAVQMTFQIYPKFVSLPQIIDNDTNANVDQGKRTKSVTYDTGVTQNIALNYGDNWKAFKIDEAQNYPASLTRDDTVITSSDKMERYTAVYAGTYKLALTLSNTNNYSWASSDDTVFYQLVINQRAISIPTAFYISDDDLNDRHEDYLAIQQGKGEPLTPDASGAYSKTVKYDTGLHYIYLFGYALENKEVNVTITPKDPSTVNSMDMGHSNVSVGSVTRGHFAFARTVNEYTVSVEFILNDDFRQPNCYWTGSGVQDSQKMEPRVFTLIIEKRGLDLPYLVSDPTQAWASDDSLSKHFTYDGAATGPSVQIANCLSSTESLPFIKNYLYDNSRTDFDRDTTTDIGTFSIRYTANVGINYILTIVIDDKNEYWVNPTDSTDTTDVKDKLIKIIIDKKDINKPVVVDMGDGDGTTVIYGTNGITTDLTWKSVIYNGSVRTDELQVTGFNTSEMTWVISDNATSRTDTNGDLWLSTKYSDAGSYTVTIRLRDTQNYKWAATADDSADRVLSLIIEPKKIAKPTLVISDCDLDPTLLPADVFDSSDGSATIDIAKTIYMRDPAVTDLNNIKGLEQTIVIANFLINDPDGTMSVVTSSSDKFTSNETDTTNKWLIYKAINAGTYTLKFSLTGNVAWNDGTGTADHFITLTIAKREYTAPSIVDLGLTLSTPVTTVSADGLTRTVTFDYTDQKLVINNYDNTIMSYHGKTDNNVTGEELVNKETVGGAGTYTFEAQGAGEYTASFLKRNFTNEFWTGITGDTITFKFVIKKLELAVPVIDVDSDFLLKGESVTPAQTQFTTTYDTLRHSVLALNVLDTNYMTYRMGGEYNTTTAPTTFVISSAAIAQSFSGSAAAGTKVLDQTVDDVYNVNVSTKRDNEFQNAAITQATLVDKENFILMEATEPGTYEVIFSLTNSNNLVWVGGTDTDKKLSFKINKVILTGVPAASGAISKTYTGSPLQFKITNANNGKATATSTPAFEYEWATIRCLDSATNNSMEIVSWYGNELIVQATEIGEYEVKVYLNEKYVQWGSSTPVQTFKFKISKSAITPTITYGKAIYLTADSSHAVGDPDTYTTGLLDAGGYAWAKSRTASAFIKLPNIRVNVNTGELDVDGIAIEVYYTNPSKPGVKIYSSSTHVFMPPTGVANATFLAGLVAGDPATALNSEWSIEAVVSGSETLYNLIFEYKIVPSTIVNEDGTLKKGNYTLHVDQNNTANSYTINSQTRGFEITPDPSPFSTESAEKYLVWELYKTSAPDTVVHTYTLAEFATDFTMWGKAGDLTTMQASNAIELDYLENDAYMFKVNFDSDGLQGPDLSATPATNFMNALVRWEVKWNGIYGGTANAKYASKLTPTSAPYSVSVTIEAKDPDAFSFPTTTYTFYYHIKPILYDLKGVEWDYDSTKPFVYDGTSHTVKLKNLPAGLSVASYDVTGYDRNVQIYAKSEADHGTGSYYETHVTFTTSNPNYVIPVEGDPTTYDDSTVAPATGFEWFVKWEIEKQEIKVQWQNEMNENGTTSEYIPYLLNYDKLVTYNYFKDDGTGKTNHANWPQVFDFSRPSTGDTSFKVIATLKTDANDPALDYDNNYKFDSDNFLLFDLGPTTKISVNIKVGNVDIVGGVEVPDVASFTQIAHNTMPDHDVDPMVNTVVYNEKPFRVVILPDGTIDTDGIATTLGSVPTDPGTGDPTITADKNLVVTYYNTVNKYRPISAPTDPGSYIIKLQFKNLPNDGNSYELAMTEFYFDIAKGTIDPDSYYWRYKHTLTAADGTEIDIVAVYDGTWDSVNEVWTDGKWLIHHTSVSLQNPDGSYYDPADPKGYPINSEITEFVFNTKGHTVELFSEDTTILIANTRNASGINAGNYKSTAAFSYNGKLWNAPVIATTFEWKIEKKTLSLADVKWADASAFEFTVSGGVVKTFTMSATGLDSLLISFTSYKTYLESDWLAGGDLKGKEISNTQSDAGTYVTQLVFDDSFDTANPNYKLGDDWPATIPNPITWTIAKHVIEVPEGNGTWTEFDGSQHDLLSAMTLPSDWDEYFTLVIHYDDGTSSYLYNGEEDYGNEYFAYHAGKYTFTFAIIEKWNASNENVIWKVDTGIGYDYTTDNQDGVELIVAKAAMKLDHWNQNDEASTAVFEAGAFNYNNFVDYKFYFNIDVAPNIDIGAPATLLDVLTVTADTHFVIEVFVKDEFADDMELIDAGTDAVRLAFKMLAPSLLMSDQVIVQKMPYIEGYESDGVTKTFTDEDWKKMFVADTDHFANVTEENYDEWLAELDDEQLAINKSQIRVNVTYNSKPITFLIHDWETGATYKNHLTIWQGDLTQNAAGDYSVTFMFVKDLTNPRCWSAEDTDNDGVADVVDRSPVTINFRVSYRMIPTYRQDIIDNFPTYTGSQIDILQHVFKVKYGDEAEAKYDEWIAEYGKYFEIIGSVGTDAGGYTLQLKILDEYINTIRWDNGSATGQPGTFIIKWKILPIYLIDPNALVGNNSSLVYNGDEQTVFTILGLSENGSAEELALLNQHANITGDRGVNAGSYTAYFTLLNTNYAWWNPTTNKESGDSDKRAISWAISPKPLDLTGIKWDYTTPFQYTLENGDPQPYEVKITGIAPETLKELEQFISYLTDGDQDNQRSLIGTYRTVVYLFNNDITQSSNYRLTGSYQEFTMNNPDPEGFGFASIQWKIIEHQFSIPDKTKVVDYSGTLRDIVEDPTLFGFEKGWENYLDVTIRYKEYGADDDKYVSYYDMASVDELLDYSMFNALYTGDYEVTFSIKSSVNTTKINVVWFDGNNHTGDQVSTLTIKPKVINITGWEPVMDDGMQVSATIISDDFYAMTEDSQALFTYEILDMATGKPVDEAQVKASGNGIYYTVEFKLIDGDGYSAKHGFEIVWAEGVNNPYEFVNENYGSQPVIWLPKPSLTATSSDTYDGKPKKFIIDNAGSYALTADMKTALDGYGVNVDDFTSLIQAVGDNAGFVNLDEGFVSVPKAGDFTITFRQLANVNISWYDPNDYEVNSAGKLCVKGGSQLTDAQITSLKLINRYAQTVDISIKKASVDYITDEMIELYTSMIPDLEYTGQEYNLKTLDDTKALFELITKTYGDLVTFEGFTGTDAGEHILRIMLTDPDSSYWNLKVSVTDVVNVKTYPGYDANYQLTYVQVDGKWVVKYLNAAGEEYNNGNYKVGNVIYKMTQIIDTYVDMDGLVDADGKPLDAGKYEVDADGVAVRYKSVGGSFVKAEDGTFLAKFKLRADGTVAEVQQFDEKGRGVIDTEKTQVTVSYIKTSTDPVDIPWHITTQSLATPTVNEDIVLRYNGTDQRVESILKGFNPTYMEIVEGGVGKNADTYTAKIGIKDENYVWRDGGEFVYVTWKIEKTTVDWTGVTWKFTDGTKDYKNGEGMVYTRTNGVATVYWVELDNLPQALQGSIKYTTNGVSGAYAGRDAGKYLTTFDILGLDTNFENVNIPEELKTVEWKIQRRLLDVPEIGTTQFIFDDEAHDLFSALKLPDNWEEYLTINVLYASNFISFVNYGGYGGEPYVAHGAGAYKFVVSFKDGVNVYNLLDSSKSQINVAWAKTPSTELKPVPPVETEQTEALKAPVKLAVAKAPVTEEVLVQSEEVFVAQETAVETVTSAVRTRTESPAAVTEVQQVCDRIKRLVCCTESQLNFRKQY